MAVEDGPEANEPIATDEAPDEAPEKRKKLRVPLRVLRVKTEHKGEVFFGYATNVSSTGIFIETTNPREEGFQVDVQFQLPGSKKSISCKAEVMWVQNYLSDRGPKPGMGLKFVEISSEDQKRVADFVEKENTNAEAQA